MINASDGTHLLVPDAAQQGECSEPKLCTADKPVRILHVLGGMDRGGVETWLMHVLRNIDRQLFQMDFLVHTDRRCSYDDELEALGSSIYYCPSPSNPLRYARKFRQILRNRGPYDVVHSHVHHFSGFVLWLAKAAGVKQRIAHSHTNTNKVNPGCSLPRRWYLEASRELIHRYASVKLGASQVAAQSLFGESWRTDADTFVLYCGIDFNPFRAIPNVEEVRAELGFKPDQFIIGHAGRFVTEKNHDLLLKIFVKVLEQEPNARLLLIGKGPLEKTICTRAAELGIAQYVRFAGLRSDVARLMLGAMDVFVLPSLHEGLGLVAIEAQAAGLPTLVSDQVPADADAGCGLVQALSLEESPASWAHEILRSRWKRPMQQQHALRVLAKSHFSIQHSTGELCELYCRG